MRIASLALLGALITFAGSESRAGFLEDYTNPLGHPGSLGSLVSPLNPLSPLSPMNPANQEEEHRRRREHERRNDDVPSVPEPKEVPAPKPRREILAGIGIKDPEIGKKPLLALTAEEVSPEFKGDRNRLLYDRAEAACRALGHAGLGPTRVPGSNPYGTGFWLDEAGHPAAVVAVVVGQDGTPDASSYAPAPLKEPKKHRRWPFHHVSEKQAFNMHGWIGACVGGECPVVVFSELICRKAP